MFQPQIWIPTTEPCPASGDRLSASGVFCWRIFVRLFQNLNSRHAYYSCAGDSGRFSGIKIVFRLSASESLKPDAESRS
jgi:hypothetical protein